MREVYREWNNDGDITKAQRPFWAVMVTARINLAIEFAKNQTVVWTFNYSGVVDVNDRLDKSCFLLNMSIYSKSKFLTNTLSIFQNQKLNLFYLLLSFIFHFLIFLLYYNQLFDDLFNFKMSDIASRRPGTTRSGTLAYPMIPQLRKPHHEWTIFSNSLGFSTFPSRPQFCLVLCQLHRFSSSVTYCHAWWNSALTRIPWMFEAIPVGQETECSSKTEIKNFSVRVICHPRLKLRSVSWYKVPWALSVIHKYMTKHSIFFDFHQLSKS